MFQRIEYFKMFISVIKKIWQKFSNKINYHLYEMNCKKNRKLSFHLLFLKIQFKRYYILYLIRSHTN